MKSDVVVSQLPLGWARTEGWPTKKLENDYPAPPKYRSLVLCVELTTHKASLDQGGQDAVAPPEHVAPPPSMLKSKYDALQQWDGIDTLEKSTIVSVE